MSSLLTVEGRWIHIAPKRGIGPDIMRTVHGATYMKNWQVWRAPATPWVARRAVQVLKREGRVLTDHLVDELRAQARKQIAAGEFRTQSDLKPAPRTVLPQHLWQKQAYWFGQGHRAVYLAMGMGTGKTKTTIDMLMNSPSHRRCLIIGPSSAIQDVWPEEVAKHYRHPGGLNIMARDTAIVKRVAMAKEMWAQPQNLMVMMNYEAVWQEAFADWAMKQHWDWVVCDEFHRAKKAGGKAAQFIEKLVLNKADRILAMSGTPMPNSPMDLYMQLKIMDPGLLGTRVQDFKDEYAIMGGYMRHEVIGWRKLKKLGRIFTKVAIVVSEDVLKLPEPVTTFRSVGMNAATRKVYTDLEDEFVAEVGSGRMTVGNSLAKMTRLQQLTSGYATLDKTEELVKIGTEKRDLLDDVLEDIPATEPLVIFARFREDIKNIREVLAKHKRSVGEYSGKYKELKPWKEGRTNTLIVQAQSGAEAIDLTRTRYAIFYSMNPSLGMYKQSVRRIVRPGQLTNAVLIHLTLRGTVDTKMYRAFRDNEEVIAAVLAEYKRASGHSQPNRAMRQPRPHQRPTQAQLLRGLDISDV